MLRRILFALSVASLSGCGKYGPPLPPEVLSPKAVKDLQVNATLEGVRFAWTAADDDLRGKELTSMDAFTVERKVIEVPSDIVDRSKQFETLATIAAPQVSVRDKMRNDAREKGLPSRRLDVPKEQKKFTYADTNVKPGTVYLYKITPVNQGGVDGEVRQLIKVTFRGDLSETALLTNRDLADEDFFAE